MAMTRKSLAATLVCVGCLLPLLSCSGDARPTRPLSDQPQEGEWEGRSTRVSGNQTWYNRFNLTVEGQRVTRLVYRYTSESYQSGGFTNDDATSPSAPISAGRFTMSGTHVEPSAYRVDFVIEGQFESDTLVSGTASIEHTRLDVTPNTTAKQQETWNAAPGSHYP